MSAIWVALSIINATGWLLPDPADKDGLGLRIRLHRDGPLLHYEPLNPVPIDVTLINYSERICEHDPFAVARLTGDLRLQITGPAGKGLGSGGPQWIPRPVYGDEQAPAGGGFSDTFFVASFGSRFNYDTGRFTVVATFKVGGKELTSPPVEFEVVKVPDDAVLVSSNVPIAGEALKLPDAAVQGAAVQQIKVGDEVWLAYRRFVRGGVAFAKRVAVLPGKGEMSVEGSYGEWGPIAITYKVSPTAVPRKIVIQSSDGMPWTEANEKTWQEKLRAKNDSPPPRPTIPKVEKEKLDKIRGILEEYASAGLQSASKRIEIRRPLMEMGEGAFPAFEVILGDPDSKSDVVYATLQILIAMKADRRRFIDLTVARLADESSVVRWKALVFLKQIGSERDAAPVVALLSDKEVLVRYEAARTLAGIGGRRELVAMGAWLKSGAAHRDDKAYLNHVEDCRETIAKRLKDNPIPNNLKD